MTHNLSKLLLAFALLLIAPTTFACSALSPVDSVLMTLDKNKDGQLSRAEFNRLKKSQSHHLLVAMTPKTFAKLDKNRNGKLSKKELNDKVDYRKHPCADWEEKMANLTQDQAVQEPQSPPPNLIKVYKSDGAVQCSQFAIAPEIMQEELVGIKVYQAYKDDLHNTAFPAVCGGQSGSINVFAIDESDEQKALEFGFERLIDTPKPQDTP